MFKQIPVATSPGLKSNLSNILSSSVSRMRGTTYELCFGTGWDGSTTLHYNSGANYTPIPFAEFLEKVFINSEIDSISLGSYTAVVSKEEVTVGCQKFPKAVALELVVLVKKVMTDAA
jgi:hypothetical protein